VKHIDFIKSRTIESYSGVTNSGGRGGTSKSQTSLVEVYRICVASRSQMWNFSFFWYFLRLNGQQKQPQLWFWEEIAKTSCKQLCHLLATIVNNFHWKSACILCNTQDNVDWTVLLPIAANLSNNFFAGRLGVVKCAYNEKIDNSNTFNLPKIDLKCRKGNLLSHPNKLN